MYIRSFKNGTFRADVRLKGVTKVKTFPTKALAQEWGEQLEENIRIISILSTDAVLSLSDDDIESMGGAELFHKLGIDVFSIRNAEKLRFINKLTKKELLQLTPQEIESKGGGSKLFIHAGKRIRNKTFREVSDEYINQWGKKDIVNQVLRLNYWCDIYGERIITDIDVFDIREHMDLLINNGQRSATINRKKAVPSSVFKYALSRGYVDENVVTNVVVTNDAKVRDRVLSQDEREKLLLACKNSKWNKLYLLVLMALTTGARRGELLNLRWSDIDFELNGTQLATSKNGSSRIILFPAVVMGELRKYQEIGKGLVFSSELNPERPKDIRTVWAAALKVAGISAKDILNSDGSVKLEKFTFHCLRHGFCTALSDSGKELSQIAEMAGHKSIQTTMRYVHQDKRQKQKIVDELARVFNL